MPEEKQQIEKRGVAADIAVGALQVGTTGLASGVSAYVGGKLAAGDADTPKTNPPPQIELPPGVEGD